MADDMQICENPKIEATHPASTGRAFLPQLLSFRSLNELKRYCPSNNFNIK